MTFEETLKLARQQFGESNMIVTYKNNKIEYVTIRFHGKLQKFVTSSSIRRILQ